MSVAPRPRNGAASPGAGYRRDPSGVISYDAPASFTTAAISRTYLDSRIGSIEVINDRELVIRHRDVFTHFNLLAITFPVITGTLLCGPW